MKPVRTGLVAFAVHLALTIGLSWLTMLMRMEEMQGPGEPTLLTQMLFGLLTLLALPLRWLVPMLVSSDLAATLTPALLPINSAIWGLLAYGLMRWRQTRLSML